MKKGVTNIKSPAPDFKRTLKIPKRISSKDSNLSVNKLIIIEERKSDRESEGPSKSEVSSVREAIMNFDSHVQKARANMSQHSSDKSIWSVENIGNRNSLILLTYNSLK